MSSSAPSIRTVEPRVYRRGSGRPLVLLHCLGVDHRLWDIAARDLSSAYEVITYDFPGHGAEPVTMPYTIADLSEQLGRFLARERLERVILGGISLGGLVAQHFAATCPERVSALVLADTTPRYTDEQRDGWRQRAAMARTAGVAMMTEPLLAVWFTPDFVAEGGEAVTYVRERFATTSGEGYALASEALAAADLRALTARIAAPTLVICGREDVASFVEEAARFEAVIPDARLVWLDDARHASVLERPEAFCEAVDGFLAGIDA